MGRRYHHSRAELRDLTLEAAERLLAKDGLAGLTARRLAGEIGYTPGTLYNLFDNLDGLILEVNAATLERFRAQIRAIADEQREPEAALQTMARVYIAEIRANPGLWSAVFEHRTADGRPVPDWYQDRLDRVFGPVEAALAPLFEAGDAAARRRAARVLWSALHGMTSLFLAGKLGSVTELSAEGMAEDLIRHYLHGLRAAPAGAA